MNMLCNECWLEIEVKGEAVATACGHLFCVKCAQTIMEQHGTCSMCENILSKSNVKLATVDQDPAILKLQLLGQSPEVAMAAALAATNFYIAQQDLYHQYREAAVRKKAQKVQDTCKVKLDEVHNGYQQAKRKYQDSLQKKAALEQELNEMQRKYSAKVMQNRKLQEMFKRVHQENEVLRNSNSHSGSHNLTNSKSVSKSVSKSLSCESNVVQNIAQNSPEPDDDNNSTLSADVVGGVGSSGGVGKYGDCDRRTSRQNSTSRSPAPSPLPDIDLQADSSERFLEGDCNTGISDFSGLGQQDNGGSSAEAQALKKLLDGQSF